MKRLAVWLVIALTVGALCATQAEAAPKKQHSPQGHGWSVTTHADGALD